jgi:hypothetical protein
MKNESDLIIERVNNLDAWNEYRNAVIENKVKSR